MNDPARVTLGQSDRTATPGISVDTAQGWTAWRIAVCIGNRKSLVFGFAIVAALLAAVVTFLISPTYTAIARVMPPQQAQSGAAAMLSQLGGLAGAAGGALGVKSPSELFISILRSDAIADALIARHNLKALYHDRYDVDARRDLASRSRFKVDKAGVITIEVDANTPRLAASLANGYVEELNRANSRIAVTEAGQRRIFFERELERAKNALADSEAALRDAIGSGGLVSVDAQSRANIDTAARLRAQITAKRVQLGAMRGYATASNPDVRKAEEEIASLSEQLERVETGMTAGASTAGRNRSTGVSADTGVRNIRLYRDVKYREAIFEIIARQYEVARIDESKEAPIIQVLDVAAPPERKSAPKRAQIVAMTFLSGFAVAVFGAMVSQSLRDQMDDPKRRDRLESLKSAWARSAKHR